MIQFIRERSHQVEIVDTDCNGERMTKWASSIVYINPAHVVSATVQLDAEGQQKLFIIETIDGTTRTFAVTDHNVQAFKYLIGG